MKQGTSNDHVYRELSRPDIVSKIKDRQQKFYTKLPKLSEADAIVKKAMYYCDALPIWDYYTQLSDQNKQNNLKNRNDKVKDSYTTMDTRYSAVCSDNSIIIIIIYSSFLYEI